MMLYVINGEDVPNSLEKKNGGASGASGKEFSCRKRGVSFGRTLSRYRQSRSWYSRNVSGSLIVAEFESLEAAQAWADADPYVSAGIYKSVTVKPFKSGITRIWGL